MQLASGYRRDCWHEWDIGCAICQLCLCLGPMSMDQQNPGQRVDCSWHPHRPELQVQHGVTNLRKSVLVVISVWNVYLACVCALYLQYLHGRSYRSRTELPQGKKLPAIALTPSSISPSRLRTSTAPALSMIKYTYGHCWAWSTITLGTSTRCTPRTRQRLSPSGASQALASYRAPCHPVDNHC